MSLAPDASTAGLRDIRIARLKDCIDPRSGLFERQIRAGAWAPTVGTEGLTSTAICLIGLSRAELPTEQVVDDPRAVCLRLASRMRDARYPGGVGLAIWAGAALRSVAPLRLLAEVGLDPAGLERVIPQLTTMEVAWLASGLLHADHPALASAREAALRTIERRLEPGTLTFRHAGGLAPLRHRLRGHVANFADQVYPVQALAFAAMVRGGTGWRRLADRCAARLVAAQGPLGQWWWHHDACTGRVLEHYPVYSVHQHSMAPMALRCLVAAGGQHHAGAIARSRGWLQGNELGIDMADSLSGVIWRSIERAESRVAGRLRHARVLIGRPAPENAAPRCRLNREMRPYEWGWLLYATALEGSATPAGHIV